jgi:serine protease Do
MVSQQRPGTKVNLDVYRDGKSMALPVTLEGLEARNNQPAERGQTHGKARWGLGLMEVNPDIRQQLELPSNVQGVAVTNVQPGSPADNAGISQGDVIEQINRHDVKTAADVQRELNNVAQGQDALVLVYSKGGSAFVVMHASEGQSAQLE